MQPVALVSKNKNAVNKNAVNALLSLCKNPQNNFLFSLFSPWVWISPDIQHNGLLLSLCKIHRIILAPFFF
jgi:hypothetical protein